LIPHLRVHTGDYVKESDALVVGPLVPHDVLRISDIEAVQSDFLREVLPVYYDELTDIDPSYVSLLYEVGTGGDTGLLQGILMSMPLMHSSPAKLMP
jgi:DNA-directed RNA polymerase subunit beta'